MSNQIKDEKYRKEAREIIHDAFVKNASDIQIVTRKESYVDFYFRLDDQWKKYKTMGNHDGNSIIKAILADSDEEEDQSGLHIQRATLKKKKSDLLPPHIKKSRIYYTPQTKDGGSLTMNLM